VKARPWPTTFASRIRQYLLLGAQLVLAGVAAELGYAITGNSFTAVGVGIVAYAAATAYGLRGGIPAELRRDIDRLFAQVAPGLPEMAAVFALMGGVALSVASVVPHAALAVSLPLALLSNLIRVRRDSMGKSFFGLAVSLGLVLLAAAVAFRAVAYVPGGDLAQSGTLLGAIATSATSLVTLGLDESLPSNGWGRVVALFELGIATWWLYAWGLLPIPWKRRKSVPDPNKFFADPMSTADDFVVLVAVAIFVLKTAPGMSAPSWFWVTVFFVVAAFPVYLVLAQRETPAKWRLEIFIRAVLVQLGMFVLMYFSGSNAGILNFSVEGNDGASPQPLTVFQSVYLAVGTLTTAGAAGITPLNDFARTAMVMQFVLPAVFALWLFGAGAVGEQAEHGHPNQELIGRRAARKSESGAESIALWSW
jgi:hypothetical protein